MKKTLLITILLLVALTVQTLGAQDLDSVFYRFLSRFVERNEQLETLTMPDVEILTTPEMEDGALYMLTFESSEDSRIFLSAAQKESIPYITFTEDKLLIGLFYSDLLAFLMKAAIGL